VRTEKVSLTLDKDLVAEARGVVGARGLSPYVNRALRNQLQHDRVAVLLAELEQEHGPIDDSVLEKVRREWPTAEDQPKRRSA